MSSVKDWTAADVRASLRAMRACHNAALKPRGERNEDRRGGYNRELMAPDELLNSITGAARLSENRLTRQIAFDVSPKRLHSRVTLVRLFPERFQND